MPRGSCYARSLTSSRGSWDTRAGALTHTHEEEGDAKELAGVSERGLLEGGGVHGIKKIIETSLIGVAKPIATRRRGGGGGGAVGGGGGAEEGGRGGGVTLPGQWVGGEREWYGGVQHLKLVQCHYLSDTLLTGMLTSMPTLVA
jgi:hypothetical protein